MMGLLFLGLFLVAVGAFFIIRAVQYGNAHQWFINHPRQFVKHFMRENVHTRIDLYHGVVEFSFGGEVIKMSIIKAKRIYDQTQYGAIRKALLNHK